jgi:mannose-1-phosphate guanylyltransferase
MDPALYAVILAGGSGTRFWPQSRKSRPKQLLTIVGNKTMIRATVERILPEIPFDRVLVLAGVSCADAIRDELPELPADRVVAEPYGRNTAPCIALAAYKLAKRDPNAVMAVLPADHIIGKDAVFRNAVRLAYDVALRGDHLVTFGIVPDRPETGYGYIERGEAAFFLGHSTVFQVKNFVEKPDRAKAKEYLESGAFFWNSGMFLWKVGAIIKAFEDHLPQVSGVMEKYLSVLNTEDEPNALEEIYSSLESVSIDYGIMEKAAGVLVIPLDCGWNDVGTWSSLHGVWGDDSEGNAVEGHALCLNSNGCIVSSPHKLATLIGVEDLIVVDTPDALLVCRKTNAQDVRKLQELLTERGYQNLL